MRTGPPRVVIARSREELDSIRPEWQKLPWGREEAAWEYFVARLGTRPDVLAPFAVLVFEGDGPVAGLAGRLESRRLDTVVGYKVVYAPPVRYLRVVDGGLVTGEGPARRALLDTLAEVLRTGEAEVLGLPAFEVGSTMLADLSALAGPLERQPFIAPWTRRRLALPATLDGYLASRGAKTRKGLRQDARRLERAFGDRLTVEIVRDLDGFERLMHDADEVAGSTYQRRLGAGFADNAEQRALVRVGLQHGWVRGYLLRLDGSPVAYWLCSLYDGTILLKTGGYLEAHAEHRIGMHLLLRVIEDAIADPQLRTLDFGPGDAGYKERLSSASVLERNVVLFAPTARARRINATRTAILGPTRLARRLLDATDLTDRLRSGWRAKLRR